MNNSHSASSILKELVAIPSQNPMGHTADGDGWLEAGMSQWLCDFFETINVTHEYHEIESCRGNVLAYLPGDDRRPTVLLDAHQDTVPVAGMTIDPFDPIEREGRIYGRGACDVKGSMAAILAAFSTLRAAGNRDHAPIIVSCSCDEERGQLGARNLIDQLSNKKADGSILSEHRPRLAIVSEPTELNPIVAHKGTARWKVRVQGVAAHSSDPDRGSNAIYRMADVLRSLQQYRDHLRDSGMKHPLCGSPTISVGTISGGRSVNIVPDECIIEIDRRVVPGEQPMDTIKAAEAFLSKHCEAEFEFLPPDTISDPLIDHDNASVAQDLLAAVHRIVPNKSVRGVAFTTHAPRFANAGIPTVVFGPGSIAQAHTEDEWIDVAQLEQATRVLIAFLTR